MLRKFRLDECNRKFLLVRHGQSIWNHDSKFTGWTNIPLTKKGKQEALKISNAIIENNLRPNIIFSSVLDRSIETSNIIKENIKQDEKRDLNIHTTWRLNEKHYGTLEGIPRQHIRDLFGKKFTKKMRSNYTMFPPIIKEYYDDSINNYDIYKNCYYETIKLGESKEKVYERTIPYYENEILNAIKSGKYPLIVTHKHTARVIMKYLLNISDTNFENYNLPEKQIFNVVLDENYKFKEFIPLKF
tara:strand:+ start:1642 stop:2373 length:732 start_codon:yes stop_codon:yes gene_type:complete